MKMPRSLALRVRFTPRAASAGILAGLVCAGPAVAVNFSCAWNITSGGSWSTAADWTSCNGSDPNNSGGNTYDATIAGSGSYTVTLSSPVTIGTLTLNDGGATLANSSTLTTTNGVTLQAGTIQGGTIVRSGGTTAVALSGSSAVGTLNGVTLHGSLDVTGASAEALFNGLVVTDITGTKPGVINVTGSSAYLYSTATQTLNNATVHLGGTTGPAYLYAPTGTLTLGSGLHMLSDGASASYGEIYGATIVNDGAISFSNGSTQNRIVPSAFTNAGTVTVQNGTSLQIGSTNGVATPTFINAGTVTVNGSGGATALEIGSQSNPQGVQLGQEWRNSGTISITDTDLRLGGYFKTSDIGTINRTGGTTELVGYLDNSGSTLSALPGMTMAQGTIHGGTVTSALAGSLYSVTSAIGTLDTVQVNGPVQVTGQSAEAFFNNLVVKDATGTTPGIINVTGNNTYLYSTATQTLNNATVNLGGTTGSAYLYAPTGTLTLGSGLHVLADGVGSYGYIYGATIVNDGAISFSNGSAQNRIIPSAFTNAGTVTVQNGTSLQIGSTNGVAAPTFINAGTVTVNGSGGATALEIGSPGNPQGVQLGQEWRNSGTISITDTDLRLGGYFKTSDIGTINRTGGTTELVGYLDNSGSTLSALPGMTMAQGTIHGGTVTSALAGSLYSVTSAIGTLDTVQVNGPLQVTGQSAEVFFNNLVVKDATGTTPGIINVTGNGAYLYSTATQTLNNATVHLGGTTGSAYLYSATGTLTLGSGLNVLSDGAGSYGYIYGTTIVNDGTITFSSGSNQGRIVPTTFTNNGTIISSNGSVAVLNPTTFTNIASGTLARGTYVVNSGSTMTFYGTTAQPTTVTTLAANVQLNGAGSTLQSFNANTNLYTTLDSSLTSIAASGSLAINTGRNFTTAGNLDNLGILSVGSGSKFDVHGNLLNFSGSTLTGGTYNVSGTFQFNGANIATNAAAVTLSGATSQIINQSGANGLASFATNASTGSFTVGGGRVFTTAGAFTNNGSLTTTGTGSRFTTGSAHFINNGTLTSTGGDSEIATGTGAFTNAGTVTVAGGSTLGLGASFTNFSGTTLSGGAYNVGGTFQFAGANIVTNAASIVLTGSGSTILNSTNKANALANFASNASTGSFSLLGGGALTTTGNFSNAGTLAIGAGSTLTLAGPGNFTQTAGKLTDDGTLSTSGSVTLSGGSVFGKGLIKGALQSSAVITPGDSATATGILTDSGAYKQNSGGSLDVSIGGATAGSGYDQLNPTTASLGGTLNIKLINGFVPKLGSTFKILNYGSETGHFATVNGLAINSGEHFALTYQSTDVLLTVMSGPSGARSSSMGASSYPRLADASSLSQTVAGARLRLAQPSTSAGVFSAASRAGLQPGSGVHRPGRFGGRATSANLQFSLLKPLSMPAFFLAVE